MKKQRNFTFMMLVIIIILIIVATFNVMKKNEAKNAVIDAQKKIKQLQQKNENLQNLDDKKDTNTFEDDISWFVEEVYTLENRKDLYEDIKGYATNDVLTSLFGDDLPPGENQGEVHSIDRKINDLEIYGKYKDESHYKAIVTLNLKFDYEDKSDSAFTVLQVDLTRKDDGWKISEFEEYAKGARN